MLMGFQNQSCSNNKMTLPDLSFLYNMCLDDKFKYKGANFLSESTVECRGIFMEYHRAVVRSRSLST